MESQAIDIGAFFGSEDPRQHFDDEPALSGGKPHPAKVDEQVCATSYWAELYTANRRRFLHICSPGRQAIPAVQASDGEWLCPACGAALHKHQ